MGLSLSRVLFPCISSERLGQIHGFFRQKQVAGWAGHCKVFGKYGILRISGHMRFEVSNPA